MVRKMLKYDLASLLRTIISINIVLIAMALLVKVLQSIDIRIDYYKALYSAVRGSYTLLVLVCCVLTCMVIIIRFYKNLFTYEGYLSFSLPVKTSQHITSKYIASLIVTAITGLTILLTEFFIDFKESLVYFYIEDIIINIRDKDFDYSLLLILIGLLLITFILTAYLIMFACISLGQSLPGNRIATSIGIFFAYFFVTFVIKITSGLFLLINYELFETIYDFLEKCIPFIEPVNTILILYIIFKLGMGVVYYIINQRIIEKRLNLE